MVRKGETMFINMHTYCHSAHLLFRIYHLYQLTNIIWDKRRFLVSSKSTCKNGFMAHFLSSGGIVLYKPMTTKTLKHSRRRKQIWVPNIHAFLYCRILLYSLPLEPSARVLSLNSSALLNEVSCDAPLCDCEQNISKTN